MTHGNNASLNPHDMTLGQYIRWARERKGMTARKLATEIGRDPAHVSRLENGTRVRASLETLHRLSVVLDVDYRNLVLLSGQTVPESLPELAEYLGAKYDLNYSTAHKLAQQFQQIIRGYGQPERPNATRRDL